MSIVIGAAESAWVGPLENTLAILLGASLAYLTTYLFEKRKRSDENLATAYSLFFKFVGITERTIKFNQHIQECLQGPAQAEDPKNSWAAMRNIIGFRQAPESISSKELALLAICGEVALVTKIQEIEDGHNILFDLFDEIQRGREIIRQSTRVVAAKDEMVTLEGDQEDIRQLTPDLQNLEKAAVGLLEMLPDVELEAKTVATQLGPKLKEHYNFKQSVSY